MSSLSTNNTPANSSQAAATLLNPRSARQATHTHASLHAYVTKVAAGCDERRGCMWSQGTSGGGRMETAWYWGECVGYQQAGKPFFISGRQLHNVFTLHFNLWKEAVFWYIFTTLLSVAFVSRLYIFYSFRNQPNNKKLNKFWFLLSFVHYSMTARSRRTKATWSFNASHSNSLQNTQLSSLWSLKMK